MRGSSNASTRILWFGPNSLKAVLTSPTGSALSASAGPANRAPSSRGRARKRALLSSVVMCHGLSCWPPSVGKAQATIEAGKHPGGAYQQKLQVGEEGGALALDLVADKLGYPEQHERCHGWPQERPLPLVADPQSPARSAPPSPRTAKTTAADRTAAPEWLPLPPS